MLVEGNTLGTRLVVVVIARENFDSGHFELFNFIKPCDVIMHKSIDHRQWTINGTSPINCDIRKPRFSVVALLYVSCFQQAVLALSSDASLH